MFRYIRGALDVLQPWPVTLSQAIEAAKRKAFVILNGTLSRTDRVGMGAGRDRPYCSGKHRCHGVNVQGIADPRGRRSPTQGHRTPRWSPRSGRPGRRPQFGVLHGLPATWAGCWSRAAE
jgi:hypothetical protein